jgi:hypothetical protein
VSVSACAIIVLKNDLYSLRLDNVSGLIAILGYRESSLLDAGQYLKMIELDQCLGLNGLPTARCATHNLVLQAQPSIEDGALKLIWSCPICEAEEQMQSELSK